MVQESADTERRRREWAATQDPKLVTYKEALYHLGLGRSSSAKAVMNKYDLPSITHPQWGTSRFFFKDDVVAAAAQRQREHDEARKAAGYRLGGIKTADVPTAGWTAEQMVKRWGNSSPRKLCERAPSIFKLPFDQAYLLLEVMRGSVIAEEGAKGQRHDLLEFRHVARRLASGDQSKRLALERHIGTYYEIPAFTRMDPEIAVAVLYELMESSPRAQRT